MRVLLRGRRMEGIVVWSACALFAASVVSDLGWRKVPNTFVLVLLGLFAVHALSGSVGSAAALWTHLAIGAAFLAAGFALYLTGGFGAGDGKLIAVAVLWIGPADLGHYLFGLAACAFSLCVVALLPFERTRRLRRDLPFAVAIAPPAVAVMVPRALSHGI